MDRIRDDERDSREGLRPGLLSLPDAFLLRVALLLQAGPLADELLLDLFDLVGFLVGVGLVELLLQEDLPLGDLPLIDPVDFGQPALLLRGERLARGGVGFGQALHREFIGAFHGTNVARVPAESTEELSPAFL